MILVFSALSFRVFSTTRFQALLFFFRFKRLPIAQDVGGSFGLHIAENMGVTVHQFLGKPIEYLVNGKRIFLVGHLGIEQNLQQ